MTAPIVVSREFRHGADELFAAWAAAAALLEWFGENGSRVVALTQDFRPGGAYRVETLDPEGVPVVTEGLYLEIGAPRRVVATWHWTRGAERPADETTVTVSFTGPPGGPGEITVVHEGLPPADARRHALGWSRALDGIASYLDEIVADAPTPR